MKILLLLILLICNSVYSQNIFTETSGNQISFQNSLFNYLSNRNENRSLGDSIGTDFLYAAKLTGSGGHYGNSVSCAGDVNGDGYDDVIVGAYGNSPGGKAYIYFGGLLIDTTTDITLTGISGSEFGCSVSSAGDVNGDGYDDVIVGAYYYIGGVGRAYIYYGGMNMNNVEDVILQGDGSIRNFGYSVCSAGDVNGDGYYDVIVGAANNGPDGKAYIYLGSSNMNNIVDIIMTDVNGVWNFFGGSVSTAGDVNGDGYSDVIVSLSGYNNSNGSANIYYGGTTMDNNADIILLGETNSSVFGYSVSNAGDVNGDGYSDVIVSAVRYNNYTGRAYIYLGGVNMNSIADITFTGEVVTQGFFGNSVSSAGDLNRDGYSDVIIGAYNYSITGTGYIGRSYIFYGAISMNNIVDITLTGEAENDRFGSSVSAAGDVNADGYSDVIIGAPGYSSNKGRSYVYFNSILISPQNNSILNPLSINFLWKKINTSVSYVLQISSDSLFNNIFINDTIHIDTFKTVGGFQRNTKYFWRVKTKDTSGITYNSSQWDFKTIPPLFINMKVVMEGMYFPVFNQMTRTDTIKVYLRNTSSPYGLVDSSRGTIDSISFTGLFNFNNAFSGTYFLDIKHFNNIETWSKSGGENLVADGSVYNYDFTTSNTKAYGNNLKLKGSNYCIYSGDADQSDFIDVADIILIFNNATALSSGRFLPSDLNGDNFVDTDDMIICFNNMRNLIGVIRP